MNPMTSHKSKQKEKNISRTIASEQCRSMFRNISDAVHRSKSGQLSKIHVPRHKNELLPPDNFQLFLATSNKDDIIWDTVTDPVTIEATLLKYNRQSFRVASVSPLGHGVIQDSLSFSDCHPLRNDCYLATIFLNRGNAKTPY